MGLQMAWKTSSSEFRRPPIGLKNLGNSCYLNSVLQCLTYTPPLAQFCLSSQHSSLCKRLVVNKEKECPFCILERQIARSLKLDGQLDAPSKVQKCLNLFAENFRWGRQEDAHEFLRYVIDSCHNTCLKLLKNRSSSCNGSSFKQNGLKEEGLETSTIMNQIFGGSVLSQVKCLSCKGESNKTDEIMDISLDVFESNSLRDALCKFFRAEVLDGSNKYSCQRCKKLSVARKQMFIVRAPNVLVIQLKRFEGAHGGKINRNIEFEEMLELSNYVYKSSQESEPRYNLFGSIVHAGYSPESGHYYAYIKDASGRWYCCNDAHVSLSSTQEVLSEKVYILFYLRCNQHQKSNKTGSSCNGVKPIISSQSDTSTCENSAETTKSSAIKINGLLSSSNNVLPVPKNGSQLRNPQFESISSNSFETSRPISNGDEKLVVHANKRSNEAIHSPTVEKAMLQSRICVESKFTDNTGGKDPSFEHSSGIQNSLMLAKRKLHDDGQADDLVSSAKKCSILRSNDRNDSLEELNKFKELLASEALSDLRSCDWFGKVHDFMRTRKRSRTHASGPPKNAELKEELINGARENFISQIPVSLKGRLIELLKSFSQSHSLLDI